MMEVVLATMIIMIGVVGVLTVSPQGWTLVGKSDKISRAAELLRNELETNELLIMNCCNALPTTSTRTVYSSGQSTQQAGDVQYTIIRTVTASGTNQWLVKVQVTWTGNANGIAESILVGLQTGYTGTCGAGTNRCP